MKEARPIILAIITVSTRKTEEKKSVFDRGFEEEGEEWTGGTQDIFQLPTVMVDAGPYTPAKTHWIYNTKSDASCRL